MPAGGKLVAFVGRLIPEKGALRLANAVQAIPGCVLAVAGTGPEEPSLAALGGPIHVLGALPHEQIVRLLAGGRLPCRRNTPRASLPPLLEAAACRCPIVYDPHGGTGELLPGAITQSFWLTHPPKPSAPGWIP